MRVLAVIDQGVEARGVGFVLRETVLVLSGGPAAGTAVMVAAPLWGLGLRLKVLVWDDAGQAKVSYCAPAAVAARRDLSAGLAGRLAGLGVLADVLAGS